MKILVIRFSSIGDIVLTSPVVRCLKQQLKDAEVHFLTKAKFKTVIANNPFIDKLYTIEHSTTEIVESLKKENYNYIIDLHNNLRTLLLQFQLKKRFYRFQKLNLQKWLMVNFKINILPKIHIVDRYLQTVRFLNVKNDQQGLDFFIDHSNKIDLNKHFNFEHPYFVAIVVGAQHATKCLTKAQLTDLCERIQQPIVLLGGQQEVLLSQQISLNKANILNLCGQLNIQQSASVLSQAAIVITPDTGLMHIAAAFGKKMIVVWGNTIRDFGMYPYTTHQANIRHIEVEDLNCRPCSKIGYKQCPKKHFKCIQAIDLNKIVEEVNQNLV